VRFSLKIRPHWYQFY